jgi:hypothetical protein
VTTTYRDPISRTAAPVDERAARRALRRQLARLERRRGELAAELGRAGRSHAVPALDGGETGPRLLSLGELEVRRDALVAAVAGAEDALVVVEAGEAAARGRVEALIADPAAHPWERVTFAELGEPGCGAYEVRPRGLLGRAMGWWRVRVSSGCPLPPRRPRRRPRPRPGACLRACGGRRSSSRCSR